MHNIPSINSATTTLVLQNKDKGLSNCSGILKHKMATENNHDFNHNNDTKEWKIRPSRMARNTKNYIRDLVENLNLTPNPEKQVIALSIGDPCIYGNIKCPQEVTEAMMESVANMKYNGYAPSTGHTEAREALAEYLSYNGVKYTANDVMMYSGCSSALDNCISVLVDGEEGHNILVPKPGFSIYRTLAEGIGGKIKYYDLLPHKKWIVDLHSLESQIDENTAAIVINNPSNPCGSVYPAEHLRQILNIASKYRLPIIADEIYERLVFPGKEFISLASLHSDVPLLICGGLAKRFLLPGWRLGWVAVHDPYGAFDHGVRKGLHALATRIIGSNTLIQGAMVQFLNNVPQSYHDDLTQTLYQNAKLCYDILKDVPGLIPTMPDGAMYMMVEIDKNCFQNMETTLEFVTKLMEEESVFCLPGECFGISFFMRIVVTPPPEMLKEACERIVEFCARHYT